jgi:hypothetical protein
MTMIEHDSRITIFRASPEQSDGDDDRPLPADYCRMREQTERAAAKKATSVRARRIHQELAQTYAAALRLAYESRE